MVYLKALEDGENDIFGILECENMNSSQLFMQLHSNIPYVFVRLTAINFRIFFIPFLLVAKEQNSKPYKKQM